MDICTSSALPGGPYQLDERGRARNFETGESLAWLLRQRVPATWFLERLTPRGISGLLLWLLQKSRGRTRREILSLLYESRALRFGSGTTPSQQECLFLVRDWLERIFPRLPAQELEMAPGVRLLLQRLGLERLLAPLEWSTCSLEILEGEEFCATFFFQHREGQVQREALLQVPCEAQMRLQIQNEDFMALYCLDADSAFRFALRLFRQLECIQPVEGRKKVRWSQVLWTLVRFFRSGS